MIQLENVRKVYETTVSLNNLNLHIKPGEFFGLLGPNGAGKTTTIRLITALTPVTEGRIKVNGHAVHRNGTRFKADVGLVPQHINLDPELTVVENLRLHGMLYKIPLSAITGRIKELLSFIEMEEKADAPVNTLSGGMKRKVLIARALMHEPSLLLLDEPTVGLDVFSRRKVWDLVKSLNARGMTILLTTHYLEEAENLCTRIGLLKKGNLIMCGSPEELKAITGPVVVEQFQNEKTSLHFFKSQAEALEFAAGLGENFSIRQARLEDVFVKMTAERVGA
ncbi:MAG: ABC transporter ATP-binding protein [Firmicutes bacterium]|nr:ABC transporter ATP-binding protein [Bacillota bacterium]